MVSLAGRKGMRKEQTILLIGMEWVVLLIGSEWVASVI